MANQDAIANALTQVFGANSANIQGGEKNVTKVEFFHGRNDEDPVEWLANFEKAAAMNNWHTEPRKKVIAASYLRDTAAD